MKHATAIVFCCIGMIYNPDMSLRFINFVQLVYIDSLNCVTFCFVVWLLSLLTRILIEEFDDKTRIKKILDKKLFYTVKWYKK